MDPPTLQRQLFLFNFAIGNMITLIATLYCIRDTLIEFENGTIDSVMCCEDLNQVVPLETFLHTLLSILLLMYGHPYLFLLNLPVVIWLWKILPEGYNPNTIGNPGRVTAYIRDVAFRFTFYCMCFLIYAYNLDLLRKARVSLKRQELLFKTIAGF